MSTSSHPVPATRPCGNCGRPVHRGDCHLSWPETRGHSESESGTTEPLSPERLAGIRQGQPIEWLPAPWKIHQVEGGVDERDYWQVFHGDTVIATLPDWAGNLALWMANSPEDIRDLLAEVDRLKAEIRSTLDAHGKLFLRHAQTIHDLRTERDRLAADSEDLAFLHRCTLPDLRRQSQAHEDGKKRWRDRAEKAEAKVQRAETVKCWTNEDGKRFVFAEDLAEALGYEPSNGGDR